tara:strand:- start:101 stop:505 length:405 start_codon:yes stop_codon:yes gene_type:complete
MNIEGGCYCGAIRYVSKGEVQASLQCHCRECQYITGGNPNVIVIVPNDNFEFTKGTPREFARSDLESPVTRLFCDKCGTAIGTRSPSRPDSMIIKVGTMDDPTCFTPQLAIFTIDKQKFHYIDENLPTFEQRPG